MAENALDYVVEKGEEVSRTQRAPGRRRLFSRLGQSPVMTPLRWVIDRVTTDKTERAAKQLRNTVNTNEPLAVASLNPIAIDNKKIPPLEEEALKTPIAVVPLEAPEPAPGEPINLAGVPPAHLNPADNPTTLLDLQAHDRFVFDINTPDDPEQPVRELQTMLSNIRDLSGQLYSGKIDGVIGPGTREAVFRLEQVLVANHYLPTNNTNPDRIYTQETADALKKYLERYPDALKNGVLDLNYQPPGPEFGDRSNPQTAVPLSELITSSYPIAQRDAGRYANAANANFMVVFGGESQPVYMQDVALILSGRAADADPAHVNRYYQETQKAGHSSASLSDLGVAHQYRGRGSDHEGVDLDVFGDEDSQDLGLYANAPIAITFAGISAGYGLRIEYATQVKDESGSVKTIIRSSSHLSYIAPEILQAFSQGKQDGQVLLLPTGYRLGAMGRTTASQANLQINDEGVGLHFHDEYSIINRAFIGITERNISQLVERGLVNPVSRNAVHTQRHHIRGVYIPSGDFTPLSRNQTYTVVVDPRNPISSLQVVEANPAQPVAPLPVGGGNDLEISALY